MARRGVWWRRDRRTADAALPTSDVLLRRLIRQGRRQGQRLSRLEEQMARLEADLNGLGQVAAELRDVTRAQYDDLPALRRQLVAARATPEYERTLADPEPLVTVRIATYERPEILFDRTVPSVLEQTYSRLEVLIVGDGAGEETIRRAGQVRDERVRFVNLPHRGVYPADPHRRWLVAGSPAMNHGARLARGRWIAPLDDDDTFVPDHVERLLTLARDGRFEMVYGRMAVERDPPTDELVIGRYPPAYSEFGFQSAMYMSALRFFEYEPASWVLDEPGDWNLCRRMMAAGVLVGFTPEVVTTLYPAGPDKGAP